MTCVDLNNEKKYKILLQHIFKECDEIMFHFPILDRKKYSIEDLASDYDYYIKEKEKFITELFKNGATQKKSKIYQGISLGYETQIIKVKLYPNLMKKLEKHHLYNWLWWNGLPEDPCFFSKNTCRFLTISHEDLFYICDEKQDYDIIRLL